MEDKKRGRINKREAGRHESLTPSRTSNSASVKRGIFLVRPGWDTECPSPSLSIAQVLVVILLTSVDSLDMNKISFIMLLIVLLIVSGYGSKKKVSRYRNIVLSI